MDALDRVAGFLEQRLQLMDAPGAVVAITDRERTLGVRAIGLSDAFAKTQMRDGDRLHLGSIGKSFAAFVAMQLKDAGKLDLDAPVTDYVPWFEVRSRYEPITTNHLLSHTSGLGTGRDFTGDTVADLWRFRDYETGFAPGEHEHYSNDGYKLVGLILESAGGSHVADLIREGIFRPLGMTQSIARVTPDTEPEMVPGYGRPHWDRPTHPSQPLVQAPHVSSDTADGSIVSSAGDVCMFLRLLLNEGGELIRPESAALMSSPKIDTDEWAGWSTHYGYGLYLGEREGHSLLGHTGSMPGYLAAMVGDRTDGTGVVVLLNGGSERDEGARNETVLFALDSLRGLDAGSPRPPDPTAVPNAAEYAGKYQGDGVDFDLSAESGKLLMRIGGETVALEPRDDDAFYALHPSLELHYLRFGRDEQGEVVEAFHGGDWFPNERYKGPREFPHPEEWDALSGHYTAHNPMYPGFRIFVRKGLLFADMYSEDWPLKQLPDGRFHAGEEDWSPRRIEFDMFVDGKPARAILDGAPYYRSFVP
ncbi:MAG: serine hydrolase domain-containing protein [Actinomycetota bacterium]